MGTREYLLDKAKTEGRSEIQKQFERKLAKAEKFREQELATEKLKVTSENRGRVAKLLQNGYDIEGVADIFDLSIEEVRKLQ